MRIAKVLFLFALASFVWGCSSDQPKEEVLRMYVSYGQPDLVADEFQKATGIRVDFLPMSSGEVITRLRAEKANPQSDVWFGGGSDAFIIGKEEGLLHSYISPNANVVSDQFKDPEGYWTAISLVTVGLIINNDRLASRQLPMSKSWADLTDPVYAGEITISDPSTSGTAYTTVSGLLQVFDPEGWEFLDKLYANIRFLEKSGSAPCEKTIQGEYAVGICPNPQYYNVYNPGADVSVVFNSDGVLAWPAPVAIVNGAKNLENAKKFIDWTLSPQGQEVLMKASPRIPTTDAEPIPGVPRPEELNLVSYDFIGWGMKRDQVLDDFASRYPQFN